jgi:hypothetical protein
VGQVGTLLVSTLASRGTRSRSRQQRHLLVAGLTSRTGGEPVGLLPGLQGHQVQKVPGGLGHIPGKQFSQRVEQLTADLVLVVFR